jgi:putative ABC transport system ATP-binding protein
MGQASDIALEGRGIGRVFGSGRVATRALSPTDIQLRRGEVTVIVGPSGSGKTTLLSILGLVLTPSEGEVWLHGRSVGVSGDEAAALRREHIGFVFQQFNLLPGLSAFENVELPLSLGSVPVRQREGRARSALAAVGLAERADEKPRALSGGEQQRVAIARALVTNASVLLCDEPTASLDGVTGGGVLQLLQRLAHESGRAIAIVTHDPRVVSIADRIIEVADGRATLRADTPGETSS